MDYFVQVFCLAGKSGFIYRFRVFGDNLNKLTEEELNNLEAGIGLSGWTVLDLVEGLPPGVEVFFDNYFSSPALLLKLK
jgi:hypothetical protein